MVARVIQVAREMEECRRQRDHHVQKHRDGWRPGIFKERTVSSNRQDNVQTRGFINRGKRQQPR